MRTLGETAEHARSMLVGARNDAYGSPRDTYALAGKLFSIYVENTPKSLNFSAEDCIVFMACVKLARWIRNPEHLDSIDDATAYMSMLGDIIRENRAVEIVASTKPAPTAYKVGS